MRHVGDSLGFCNVRHRGILCDRRAAAAAERLAGPYPAEVERVVDGDTLAVRVAIWLQQDLNVLVRIRGIDAPELRGRCDDEKARARGGMVALEELVAGGEVALTAIEGDKYFGRVIADVATSAGENVGAALIAGGYVRTYDGGETRILVRQGISAESKPRTISPRFLRHLDSASVGAL